MKLYRTKQGPYVESEGRWHGPVPIGWSELVCDDQLLQRLGSMTELPVATRPPETRLAPLESGEVWAAGVTYYRSRTARMEESQVSGGGSFYDRVYEAERPELFFKSTPHRTVGPGAAVRIRSDARWNVPEPELGIVITPSGKRIGYTIGNDMSSRDIEGENPLYLPQAKVYNGSCALGPCILVSEQELPGSTAISLEIRRGNALAFEGATKLSEMKRSADELVSYLMRDNSFPFGCVLLTGTGVIPPDDFTLCKGDEVRISIDPIGTLVNEVN